MRLSSKRYKITEIKKRTQAKVFEDFEHGDILSFHTELKHTGGASGGSRYANYIECYNHSQGTQVRKSQNNMINMLRKFELTKVTK